MCGPVWFHENDDPVVSWLYLLWLSRLQGSAGPQGCRGYYTAREPISLCSFPAPHNAVVFMKTSTSSVSEGIAIILHIMIFYTERFEFVASCFRKEGRISSPFRDFRLLVSTVQYQVKHSELARLISRYPSSCRSLVRPPEETTYIAAMILASTKPYTLSPHQHRPMIRSITLLRKQSFVARSWTPGWGLKLWLGMV